VTHLFSHVPKNPDLPSGPPGVFLSRFPPINHLFQLISHLFAIDCLAALRDTGIGCKSGLMRMQPRKGEVP
jgi:hypothetical protein